MTELSFECIDVYPEPYAAAPTLLFRLRIAELDAAQIHAIALRCQIRIEPQRRRYNTDEAGSLSYLFGDPARWGETLRPFQFAQLSLMVSTFTGSTEVELPVPCTYDLEVAAGKYFHALDDGVVPMKLLFSGTVFGKGANGFWVEQVPWHKEAAYPLPVAVWQRLVDLHFPGESWVRLRRETVDVLLKYRSDNAIPSWDRAIEKLLADAGESAP